MLSCLVVGRPIRHWQTCHPRGAYPHCTRICRILYGPVVAPSEECKPPRKRRRSVLLLHLLVSLLRHAAEFAFEIGSSLLTEVRRLQDLLADRDKAIQGFKEERDDHERTIEGLKTALRQQEASTG